MASEEAAATEGAGSSDNSYSLIRAQNTLEADVVQASPPPCAAELAAVPEEEEILDFFDIPADAYGATILALVRDIPKVLQGEEVADHMLHSVYSIALIVVNLVVQVGLVYLINDVVVSAKVHEVQVRYQKFHQEVFDNDANFQQDLWDQYDDKDLICEVGPGIGPFYLITLFIWVIVMLAEIRSCLRLCLNIYAMPRCEEMGQMLRNTEERTSIMALTRPVKTSLFVVVLLPKALICTALLFAGLRWLTATTRFEDLVMNAVAMDFVLRIDELLYEVVIPPQKKQQVEDIDFAQIPKQDEDSATREVADKWAGYGNSSRYLIFCFCLVYIYSQYMQEVLPDISDAKRLCRPYLAKSHVPICTQNEFMRLFAEVFGGAVHADCYPFGDLGDVG